MVVGVAAAGVAAGQEVVAAVVAAVVSVGAALRAALEWTRARGAAGAAAVSRAGVVGVVELPCVAAAGADQSVI